MCFQPPDPSLPRTSPKASPKRLAPESVSFPGSYANLLGGTDWEPADPTVQAADAEGDGIWTLTVTLPGGDYEYKVAVNGTWDENYGREGAQGGENIPFTVPDEGGDVTFSYNRNTGEISIQIAPPTQVAGAAARAWRRPVCAQRRPARQPQRSLPHSLWGAAGRHGCHPAPAHGGQRRRERHARHQ